MEILLFLGYCLLVLGAMALTVIVTFALILLLAFFFIGVGSLFQPTKQYC